MKYLVSTLILMCISTYSFADNAPQEKIQRELPTPEHAFIETIPFFDKAKIVETIGEPSFKADSTDPETGKVDASVWRYHYLNTNADGDYYQTTELDFVEDKVAVVVFMNGDDETSGDKVVSKPLSKPQM